MDGPAQIHRNGKNIRGYKVEFEGDPARHRAFYMIKQISTNERDPTEAYIRGNRPI